MCAGSLNSTEILLRSQARGGVVGLSPTVGKSFSGNGDSYGVSKRAGSGRIAGMGVPPSEVDAIPPEQRPGPCITSVVRVGFNGKDIEDLVDAFVVEDAVGPSIGRAVEGLVGGEQGETQTFLVMSHDRQNAGTAPPPESNGVMKLSEDDNINISWPDVGKLPAYETANRWMKEASKGAFGPGDFTPNMIWKLPLGDSEPDGAVTVHPLGGCAMGDNVVSLTMTGADGLTMPRHLLPALSRGHAPAPSSSASPSLPSYSLP